MRMPTPRGPLSEAVFSALLRRGGSTRAIRQAARRAVSACDDLLHDGDVQGTLFVLYELHYRGVDGVHDEWEWNPGMLELRGEIESGFEEALRREVPVPPLPEATGRAVADALFLLTADDGGPSMSRYVARSATDDQLREFLIQRSIYQLKEADPHAWAIPRLEGVAKAALVEIESDEYGGGRPDRMHAAIFAGTMRGLGLDDSYGAYVDAVPAITLASANMMSFFGLHRRLRGAIVGHLAAFEMTSSIPNRLYGNGFRRHRYDENVTWYFDEHVEADAVHEQIAARDLAGGLVEAEPDLLADVMFGAAACLTVDGMVAEHILGRWQRGLSSLRESREPALVAAM